MDDKEAKKLLREHTTALQKLLGDNLKEEAIKQAKGAKLAKKTFIDRVKEFPVVEKISSLGTAGTVAVSTAAVTQADLAVNYTEVVVAQVAEDVYTGVIEPPGFINAFVDFDSLHTWGQQVIAEKVAEVSELQPTSAPSVESSDTTPQSSASSQGTASDTPSQKQATESKTEPAEKESKAKENNSSKDSEKGQDKEGKQEQPQEQQTEEKKESQENNTSEESKTAELPIVNTTIDSFDDDIKPHSDVRSVSPTN